jgi:hypothetical protein
METINVFYGAVIYLTLCGFFAGYVADARGRSAFVGFMFGVLFGPLGVIAVGGLPILDADGKLAVLVSSNGMRILVASDQAADARRRAREKAMGGV